MTILRRASTILPWNLDSRLAQAFVGSLAIVGLAMSGCGASEGERAGGEDSNAGGEGGDRPHETLTSVTVRGVAEKRAPS